MVAAHDELLPYLNVERPGDALHGRGGTRQEGIRRAEAQLDILFSERSLQGLTQSVFVKRWGNANAELTFSSDRGGMCKFSTRGNSPSSR